jgi:hypothetical protein
MRKAILGAASALARASPAAAADLSVTPRYSEVPSYEREVRPYEYRTATPVSRSRAPSFPIPSWFAGLSLECMRHLLCMRMPVRFGVTDGAIDVTSAAAGKVSAM